MHLVYRSGNATWIRSSGSTPIHIKRALPTSHHLSALEIQLLCGHRLISLGGPLDRWISLLPSGQTFRFFGVSEFRLSTVCSSDSVSSLRQKIQRNGSKSSFHDRIALARATVSCRRAKPSHPGVFGDRGQQVSSTTSGPVLVCCWSFAN